MPFTFMALPAAGEALSGAAIAGGLAADTGIFGSILTGVSGFQAAQAQASAERRNAAFLQQAAITDAAQAARRAAIATGRTRAQAGAAGTDPAFGSPLDLTARVAAEGALDIANARVNRLLGARDAGLRAQQAASSGRSTLLTSFGSAARTGIEFFGGV